MVTVSLYLHALATIALIARPRAWPAVVAVVLADHLLLVAASLWPRGRWIGANLRRLPASDRPGVALTFDDGPDPRVTPAVLAQLELSGARAAFFCIGERAASHPQLVREIARRGHRVENHSFRHLPGFCFLPPTAAGVEIDRAQALLTELSGAAPRFFRAPAGLRNPWLDGVLAARGLLLVSWTRRGFDTVSRSPDAVLKRLTRGLTAGDVLLLHDGSSPKAPTGRPVVLEVLPRLLAEIERRGLAVVPLDAGGEG